LFLHLQQSDLNSIRQIKSVIMPVKILVAPDSFKESLSAIRVAECLKAGISSVLSDAIIDLSPVTDQ
jgi:hypothetical protein